jgi:choline dehydrogenase-like flavoprotein
VMKAAQPDLHFSVPCARLRLPVGERAACCVSGICHLCPVGAKFTALNTFGYMTEDPRVDICVNARVSAVETAAGTATGLRFEAEGKERVAKGELIAVGANGIQTPFILQRSGFKHPALGKYLHEKLVLQVEVFLDGLNNFDGGLPMTGLNLSFADGDHRKTGGAAMIYFQNGPRHGLRSEFGRWRQTLPIEIFVEDMPQETSTVTDEGGPYPVVRHPTRSDYAWKGADYALAKLPEVLKPLPVESIRRLEDLPTGSHVQGTVRMGKDANESVVDADLIHHEVRNLMVLGTAVFPTCGTANPSLTAAALSLRAAARLPA